jgi:hypothetical protein
MNKTRLAHLSTVLGIVFSQLQFVWLDGQADLANKICNSVVVLLTLIFVDPTKFSFARTITSIAASLLALTVSHLITKGTFGTAATGILTTAAAVFARMPAVLATATPAPAPVATPNNVVPISEGRAPMVDESPKIPQDDVS